jgi:hypothetical protein
MTSEQQKLKHESYHLDWLTNLVNLFSHNIFSRQSRTKHQEEKNQEKYSQLLKYFGT